METYALGDIHGRAPALEDVLEKSNFDFEKDRLIVLGDIVDGYPWTRRCLNILENIKNKVIIKGNHCAWALNWFKTGMEPPVWTMQGGYNTLQSYDYNRLNVPPAHVKMLETAKVYYIDDKNNIYCHGGFNWRRKIETQSPELIMWDRKLVKYAHDQAMDRKTIKIGKYNRIFVGHTSTGFYDPEFKPQFYGNLVMLDTGAGDRGKLTIMNVKTFEYWQSDLKQFKKGISGV